MNKPTVRFCAEAYEVKSGDVINFQAGGQAYTVTKADYLWKGMEIINGLYSLTCDNGERFIVPARTPVHIIRPATMMIRILKTDGFLPIFAGDVLPAYWYTDMENLAKVSGVDTLHHEYCYRMPSGYTKRDGEFEIVEVL